MPASARSVLAFLAGAIAASERVRAASWIDYLHLARYNGRWVIVNVLWEYDAGSCTASASPPAGCATR